jgi:hypothetical protein
MNGTKKPEHGSGFYYFIAFRLFPAVLEAALES